MNENRQGFWSRMFFGDRELIMREGTTDSAGGDSLLTSAVPPARPVYPTITPETAMTIGTAYRSGEIISNTLSSLDVGVFKNGIQLPINYDNRNLVIKRPNTNGAYISDIIQELTWSLVFWGNAYLRYWGDGTRTTSIEVMDPNMVAVERDENGRFWYHYGSQKLGPDKVRHLKLDRQPGQVYGFGPVQKGVRELQAALALQQFQATWFDTSGVPTGVLHTDQSPSATQSAAVVEAWKAFLKEHGGTGVLPYGYKYETIALKPIEAQYIEVEKENNIEIARIFGIPPMHLTVELEGTTNTYTNLEQLNILFMQNTLSRYMTEIENALSSILPGDQKVKFIEESLLRMDTLTKWTVIQKQVEVGYTSGEEIRAAEGKPALPKETDINGNS